MITFPVELPPFSHGDTYARPIIESASVTSCLARATFKPKSDRYVTVVRLDNGEWTITTTKNDGKPPSSEHYPHLRGHELGLRVINWWTKAFSLAEPPPLPKEIVTIRATWITRAAHKLLTEVGDASRQLAALQILGKNYGLEVVGGVHDLKGAQWAIQANQNLERTVPAELRAGAVALLIEVMTGIRPKEGTGNGQAAA